MGANMVRTYHTTTEIEDIEQIDEDSDIEYDDDYPDLDDEDAEEE
jgi:hypothetical protein